MSKRVLFGAAALSMLLLGCSRHIVNQSELDQVKRVAVIMYSVPETIVRDVRDPKEISDDRQMDSFSFAGDMLGSLGDGVKKAADVLDSTSHIQKQINGVEAAEITLVAMITELSKETGWAFLSPSEVSSNERYQALSTDLRNTTAMKMEADIRRAAGVPTGYINLGLPHGHGEVISYQSNEEFRTWVSQIARVLDVDAVIVASDTGYATDGKSLIRGGACITKSAMHFAMFNVNGDLIVDTRVSFDEAPKVQQSGCVNGSFYKSDYKGALIEHGREQARQIVAKLSK
ncbi:hypothetical protein ABHV50_000688 [Vibrio vulnificus]|nr:hypothetical protein [Vibrio vulnificus]HDU8731452.1 hypothetical protein [Vibrio vulnificus]HDU8764720.1 hypothetical protein [Vibrio vulnificus]